MNIGIFEIDVIFRMINLIMNLSKSNRSTFMNLEQHSNKKLSIEHWHQYYTFFAVRFWVLSIKPSFQNAHFRPLLNFLFLQIASSTSILPFKNTNCLLHVFSQFGKKKKPKIY
eukprot:NODE_92_length_21543_cov_0.719036.p19 type:complete len:113 gc:universal NODE_92_length_21543_cov_0.719036:1728-1390(-)